MSHRLSCQEYPVLWYDSTVQANLFEEQYTILLVVKC